MKSRGSIKQSGRCLTEPAHGWFRSGRVSLTDIVGRAVNLARAQSNAAAHGNVEIEFEPPADPIIVAIDPAQIEDAVLN
jgi:hypothetical protein